MKNLCVVLFLIIALSGCEEDAGKASLVSHTLEKTAHDSSPLSNAPNLIVNRWGPKETLTGSLFNKQKNGVSALWFKMDGEINAGTKFELWFGDIKLADKLVLNSEMVGSAYVPTELIEKAGDYPVYLVEASSKKKFDIGVFKVMAASSVETKDVTKTKKSKNLK